MESNAFKRVRTARHPDRPYSLNLFERMFEDFVEIKGDRRYADDPAIICGLARLGGEELAVIGQQKGRDTNQRRFRNFGMPKPEGYRKALRLMQLADKFSRPVVTFIDTPGAYPGIDAEERGQAEAIALNLREMASFGIPLIAVVLGEGGSGGALAIAVGDRVLMMENAVYSVISPEGCAAILWKDSNQSERAAESLRLTAQDLLELEVIDEIVEEPEEWHFSEDFLRSDEPDPVSGNLLEALQRNLSELKRTSPRERRQKRFEKFRKMGRWASAQGI